MNEWMDELKWLDLEKHISFYIVHLAQELASFLHEGQIVNTFRFVGHMVYVTTTQLCHCIGKAATDSTKMMAVALFQ